MLTGAIILSVSASNISISDLEPLFFQSTKYRVIRCFAGFLNQTEKVMVWSLLDRQVARLGNWFRREGASALLSLVWESQMVVSGLPGLGNARKKSMDFT